MYPTNARPADVIMTQLLDDTFTNENLASLVADGNQLSLEFISQIHANLVAFFKEHQSETVLRFRLDRHKKPIGVDPLNLPLGPYYRIQRIPEYRQLRLSKYENRQELILCEFDPDEPQQASFDEIFTQWLENETAQADSLKQTLSAYETEHRPLVLSTLSEIAKVFSQLTTVDSEKTVRQEQAKLHDLHDTCATLSVELEKVQDISFELLNRLRTICQIIAPIDAETAKALDRFNDAMRELKEASNTQMASQAMSLLLDQGTVSHFPEAHEASSVANCIRDISDIIKHTIYLQIEIDRINQYLNTFTHDLSKSTVIATEIEATDSESDASSEVSSSDNSDDEQIEHNIALMDYRRMALTTIIGNVKDILTDGISKHVFFGKHAAQHNLNQFARFATDHQLMEDDADIFEKLHRDLFDLAYQEEDGIIYIRNNLNSQDAQRVVRLMHRFEEYQQDCKRFIRKLEPLCEFDGTQVMYEDLLEEFSNSPYLPLVLRYSQMLHEITYQRYFSDTAGIIDQKLEWYRAAHELVEDLREQSPQWLVEAQERAEHRADTPAFSEEPVWAIPDYTTSDDEDEESLSEQERRLTRWREGYLAPKHSWVSESSGDEDNAATLYTDHKKSTLFGQSETDSDSSESSEASSAEKQPATPKPKRGSATSSDGE